MRRATTITLAIMGGGLLSLGAVVAVGRHNTDRACAAAEPDARTSCGSSSGGHGGSSSIGSHGSSGSGAAAEASGSSRGGFGASGGGHGGE